ELARVKKHVAEDLLASHDSRVTYSLLGMVGAAALYRFAGEGGRFALWLTGLTGSGKSFLAKLFANFFGHVPLSSGRFATWASTISVPVPQGAKDLGRGARCVAGCKSYSAVTADFLRWFLADGRAGPFARRVRNLQRYYYRGIAGQQNDARIASNFALLAAGF